MAQDLDFADFWVPQWALETSRPTGRGGKYHVLRPALPGRWWTARPTFRTSKSEKRNPLLETGAEEAEQDLHSYCCYHLLAMTTRSHGLQSRNLADDQAGAAPTVTSSLGSLHVLCCHTSNFTIDFNLVLFSGLMASWLFSWRCFALVRVCCQACRFKTEKSAFSILACGLSVGLATFSGTQS